MTQNDRVTFLKDLGYTEPFDESPIDNPEGWYGGSISNTGGNKICRIWRTWEKGERARDTEYEIIYDVSQDASVALQEYIWHEKYNSYNHNELVVRKRAEKNSDEAQALVAEELMNEYQDKTE